MTGGGATAPNGARIWNYLLGGTDNYAADRLTAQRCTAVYGGLPQMARDSRRFAARAAVAAAEDGGIRQFIDLGAGIPAPLPGLPSIAEAVHQADHDAVTVSVDLDPLVLCLTGPGAVKADLADAGAVLRHPALVAAIVPSRPVCVILGAVLHLWGAERAAEITAGYADRVAAGSWIVISVASFRPETGAALRDACPGEWHNHGREEVASWFAGLELLPPGVTDARLWRPCLAEPRPPRQGVVLAGAGVKR